MADGAERESGAAAPEPARRRIAGLRGRIVQSSVLRWLALASVAGLVVLGPHSGLPWLATFLALLAAGFILLGWRPGDLGALRRSDPVRAARSLPERRFNAVLDAIALPTILVDHRGNVVHANASALALYPGLRVGHSVSSALRAPVILSALETVLVRQPEARAELIERFPLERSFDVTIRRMGRAVEDEHPALGAPFAVLFMTETTAARRVEAMRVDFVANASHELRTPLASILGFIETLQGPARDDAEARRNFLGIMANQARRMKRLIEDLLSLSKIEMTAHIPPSGIVNPVNVVRSVCDALGGLARERGVELKLAGEDEARPVTGDRDELLRVFENLVENAIKYGQSGGRVDITFARETDPAGPMIAVTVRDHGPGIAAEHLPRLTERFYRADVSESRVLGGTGLGLAIVKHIITRHRGRLAVASTLGEGASFTVTFPEAPERKDVSLQ